MKKLLITQAGSIAAVFLIAIIVCMATDVATDVSVNEQRWIALVAVTSIGMFAIAIVHGIIPTASVNIADAVRNVIVSGVTAVTAIAIVTGAFLPTFALTALTCTVFVIFGPSIILDDGRTTKSIHLTSVLVNFSILYFLPILI